MAGRAAGRPGGRAAGRPGGQAAGQAGQAGQASNHKPPQNVIVHFCCLNDAVVSGGIVENGPNDVSRCTTAASRSGGGQLSMFIIIMFNILKQYSKTHVIRLQR